jgi:transcriptional regulator with XRE-family HTH domain
MGLKQVFIRNLRKFRNSRGLSQMKLAELCDTAPSYIGEIEIGRRFPSLKLIEKIGRVLNIEPYRFFIDETEKHQSEVDEVISLISKLPDQQRLAIINKISSPCESTTSP